MTGRPPVRPVLLGAALLVLAARPSAAQSASVHLGRLFNSDGDREEAFNAYGLRADHALGRWIVAELGASYAPVELTRYGPGPGGEPARRYRAPRRALDAQIQLQLPLRAFRPYVAAGAGGFAYRRLPDAAGRRELLRGTTRFAALGLRIDLGRHVGARGELRIRRDRPSFGYFGVDAEPSLGVALRW